ncbi:hypothetical protein HN51_025684 [Arachis hypogaea]
MPGRLTLTLSSLTPNPPLSFFSLLSPLSPSSSLSLTSLTIVASLKLKAERCEGTELESVVTTSPSSSSFSPSPPSLLASTTSSSPLSLIPLPNPSTIPTSSTPHIHFPMIEEVCPTHGECYAGMLECFKGYRKHPNLCVEDSEISESARKIVERVEFYLCEEYAQFMCYETGSIWVSEDELWNCLEPFGDVSSDNTLYNFTKEKAIELIGK